MDTYLKFSGREHDFQSSSMANSQYGGNTGKISPRHLWTSSSKSNARVTAEGGITTSRMFVREAREKAQEQEMIEKLNKIEQRMKQCQSEK